MKDREHGDPVSGQVLLVGDRVSHPNKKYVGTVVASNYNGKDVDIFWPGEGIKHASPALYKNLRFDFCSLLNADRNAWKMIHYLLEALESNDPELIAKMIDVTKINIGHDPGTPVELRDVNALMYGKRKNAKD